MLPVLDISDLPDEKARTRVAREIENATRDSGFFYIRGHGVDKQTISELRQVQREFFSLDEKEKNEIAINQYNRGYLGHGNAKMHGSKTYDQKEVFFWGRELADEHPDIVNNTPLCGPNQWPRNTENFKPAVLRYAQQIAETGNKLLECVALALGADADFFAPYFQDSMLRGQLIHYPPTTGDESHFGVAPHTDFGCLTLLLQELDGLEVWQNDTWITAPPIENTLVVNIGDLLEKWSNGRMPSTRHRVRNNTHRDRYSIAMFHDPAPNALIDAQALDPTANIEPSECVRAAEYILGRNRGAFAHYGELSTELSASAP